MSRKASLNLSMNAIVIFILAMAVLGLGGPFIKKIFDQANTISDDEFRNIKNANQQAFIDGCREEMCLKDPTMEMRRGEEKDTLLVIYNKFDCQIDAAEIYVGDQPGGSEDFDDDSCKIVGEPDAHCSDVAIETLDESLPIPNKEKDNINIIVNVRDNAKTTFYTYIVRVTGSCETDGTEFSFDKRKPLKVNVIG